MAFKRPDTFSIGWSEPAAAPATARGSSASVRADPASMPMAGARSGTAQPSGRSRGIVTGADTRAAGASTQRDNHANGGASTHRESAKDAIFGGGSPKQAPSTPARAIGGRTSMGGILSTPEAVLQVAAAPEVVARGKGRGVVAGAQHRFSQIDFSDSGNGNSSASGSQTARAILSPNSRLAASAAGAMTKSRVSMSDAIDTTPLRTGKNIAAVSRARGSVAVTDIGTAEHAQRDALKSARGSRPASAANQNRFKISGDGDAAEVTHSRPHTASSNRATSDIFNVSSPTTGNDGSESARVSARPTGRAHVRPTEHRDADSTIDTHAAMHGKGGRRPNTGSSSAGMSAVLGATPSFRYQDLAAQTAYNSLAASADSSSSASASTSQPSAAQGSQIPQLKLGGIPSVPREKQAQFNGNANGAAGVVSEADGGDGNGRPTRRAYGNARNASTLFDSSSQLSRLQAKGPAPQVPDVPPRMAAKKGMKVAPKKSSAQVRGVLGGGGD